MKYGDLIQFDPIETVVQLRDASDSDHARQLVESFVISRDLAERLIHLVIPQLQFTSPSDNKGLLVVGNYGTGKSHLMAVISAIAEREDLYAAVTRTDVREAAAQVAGRFHVVRTEIGSTEMPLREILTRELEARLVELGIQYRFPGADQVSSNKRCFEEMMSAFHGRYPDHGLLLVVDELLDFLRSRRDQQLILDLNFLRELGESCTSLRLRFIAGVQEAIFDSQRFSYVADSVRRVKDRFEQVLIARTDVQFVVAERLLRKTPDQRARIRVHLKRFTRLYGRLGERLDEYVSLFPVHPDYIATFERVAAVEKREILKTLSLAMDGMIDEEVPESEPGLIAYDSYWSTLRANPAFRTLPDIREIIDCSEVLESRVRNAYTRPPYRPMAIRVIRALSVHRLTTGDIHSPIGATASELRDSLCLYQPGVEDMGNEPAEDLLAMVQTVLREIHRTVSGQFITENSRNGQYYLDIGKTHDFDARIEARAETLDDEHLDRAYYRALLGLMDVSEDQPYVTGFQIWEHDLVWRERNTTRPGYLFFGAPNERSTAAPPRDFYVYFLQPFGPPRFRDEQKADEVFFRFGPAGDGFRTTLTRFAAANALAKQSAGAHKAIYGNKAQESLGALTELLREQMFGAFRVTHEGRNRKVKTWLRGQQLRQRTGANPHRRMSFRAVVDGISEICLESRFRDTAPEYPSFGVLITRQRREQAARGALAMIAGQRPAHEPQAVLKGLELLDGETIRPDKSRYARFILDALAARKAGQVVRREELITETADGVEYLDPANRRLEPEWVVVVLAALVHSGHILLSLSNRKFDALSLTALATTPLPDLIAFRYIVPPKDWNLPAITALFELVGLPSGVAKQLTRGKAEAVQRFQQAASGFVERLAAGVGELRQGITLWGKDVLDSSKETDELRERITKTRQFIESVQVLDTPAKFKNFRHSVEAVEQRRDGLVALDEVEGLQRLVSRLHGPTQYLSRAEAALPADHHVAKSIRNVRDDVLASLRRRETREASGFLATIEARLTKWAEKSRSVYIASHQRARLGPSDDARRRRLLQDLRVRTLGRYTKEISLLPKQQIRTFEAEVQGLPACPGPSDAELSREPICPCGFRPTAASGASASAALNRLARDLDRLEQGWADTLRTNLDDDATRETCALLPAVQQALIEKFRSTLSDQTRLSASVDAPTLAAVAAALSRLEKVEVEDKALARSLLREGGPATPAELRRRLEDFLEEITRGRDMARVRIVRK